MLDNIEVCPLDVVISGNYLVRVRAQVMSRDDSSGGWVPLGGGGLSNVSVRKKPRASPSTAPPGEQIKPKHDYLIYGIRISDQSIVLSCTIKKDFEYNKVMPTFHHWKTGDKRFGLTFQTAADARAFDKGVRTAVEDLLDGLAETYPLPLKLQEDDVDNDVFMTLNLPHEPEESRSSSDSSTKLPSEITLHKVPYIREKPLDVSRQAFDQLKGEKGENYAYVQLTAVPHEYVYPVVEEPKATPRRTSSSPTTKKAPPLPPDVSPELQKPPMTKKVGGKIQYRCRHCHELFALDRNPRGACEYAPDVVRTCINAVSCLGCAQCMCYHCYADAEGDYAQHPCQCTNDENNTNKWLCLTILSIFVPCLMLYPPLRMCHLACMRCGACGGRHAI